MLDTNDRPVNKPPLRLNVGAGTSTWGDLRLDVGRTLQLTVLGDMNALPFVDDTFSEILLDNVLEHATDTTGVLAEIHRVLRPGGIAYVYVPFYTAHGAYSDPTHRSFFTEQTFDYYSVDAKYDHYADFAFERVSTEFHYSKAISWLPWRRLKLKLGHVFGDLVLAMKVVLRKPGGEPVTPTIDGWLQS